MKKIFNIFIVSIFCSLLLCPHCKLKSNTNAVTQPELAIVIDDFGSYDEAGVQTLLKTDIPLTCAVLPNVDNTTKHLTYTTRESLYYIFGLRSLLPITGGIACSVLPL